MSNSEITLKATPFLAITTSITERLPAGTRDRLLAGLAAEYPDDTRRVLDGHVLASDTFSLRFATELIERAAAEVPESPISFAHAIGRRGAESSTGGVLRVVFSLLSMGSYLGKIQPVWSKFYSHGRITYQVNGRTAEVRLDDFPFVSATNCARVTGSFEWFGQRAERTAVITHVMCRSRGDDACKWSVTW